MATQPRFQPYGNNILIQLDDALEQSAGGIFLPGQAQDKPVLGTAIAVGPGLKTGFDGTTIPPTTQVGDRLLVMKFAVQHIKLPDNRVLTIIAEGDIYGRFVNEEVNEPSDPSTNQS